MTTTQPRTRKAEFKTVKNHGFSYAVRPEVGAVVKLDERDITEQLLDGDGWSVPGYAGCDFRFPIFAGPIKNVAVNVEVVGRTLQRRSGADWVRVKIEWVGDCEPSTFSKGWMLVK